MEGNLEVRKMSEGFGITLEMQIFKEDSVKLSDLQLVWLVCHNF
jgi:hypothetical protein